MGIGSWSALRALAVAVAAATLAACAQPAMLADQPEPPAVESVPVAEEPAVAPPPAPQQEAAPAAKKRTGKDRAAKERSKDRAASASGKPAAAKRATAYGLASFYNHRNARTASGEKFNSRDLTAAHRTLPFGTRVRVTELASGRSVTVRINDRGPFIPGRIVDVSKSAAEELGIVGRGIARVKLDVVDDEPPAVEAGPYMHAHAE